MAGGSAKMQRIRWAAVCAVMPASSGKVGTGGASAEPGALDVQRGLERFHELYGVTPPNWVRSMVAAKFAYAEAFTEVTLQPPANGTAYRDYEDLTVSVRHTLYLAVPYANRLFGHELGTPGDYGTEVEVSCTLTNEGVEDDIDVEQFPRYVGRGAE